MYKYGSGIFTASGTVIAENSTIAYNTTEGIYNHAGTLQAVNSIIYYNSGNSIAGNGYVDYCDVEGGWPSGEGNIDVNPRFESVLSLKIRETSPCVDAGDSYVFYNDLCFAPSWGTVLNDMGAHGGPGACGWCLYGRCDIVRPVTGDFDGDGDIDATDLLIFSANYGSVTTY